MRNNRNFIALCVALLIGGLLPPDSLAQSSFEEFTVASDLVPGDVKVGVLLPPGYRERPAYLS